MKEKLVKALMIEPYKHPCVVELECDLDSLQKAVSIGANRFRTPPFALQMASLRKAVL